MRAILECGGLTPLCNFNAGRRVNQKKRLAACPVHRLDSGGVYMITAPAMVKSIYSFRIDRLNIADY
jgi:hypothetical protein